MDSNPFSVVRRVCLASVVGVVAALPMTAVGADSVTVKYEVKANDFSLGEATHTVVVQGDRYTIIDVEKATGFIGLFTNSITRKSVGVIVNDRPRPTSYSETAKNKSRVAKLDWSTKTATFSVDPKKTSTFDDTTVDRVSFAYQYYFMKKAPPSGTFNQMVADVKRVEEQSFKTIGTVTVDTPMGKIEAIQLERAGDSKNMKLWVSPKHDYLPVRIIFIDKENRVFDQLITEIVKKP